MPVQMRIGDTNICGKGATGVFVAGSPNVRANNIPTIRIGDPYVCPHCQGVAVSGSPNVFINNIPSHRVTDTNCDCDGCGNAVSGSPNVFIN